RDDLVTGVQTCALPIFLQLHRGAVALGVGAGGGREPFRERGVGLRRDVLVARAVEQLEQGAQVLVRLAERQVAVEPQLEQMLARSEERRVGKGGWRRVE